MFLSDRCKSSLRLVASTSVVAIAIAATPAMAQSRNFDVPAQPAEKSIPIFAKQAGVQIVASGVTVRGKQTNAVHGQYSVEAALRSLLQGTGLTTKAGPRGSNFITIIAASPETSALATSAVPEADAGASKSSSYDNEIIVTAQKKEERIQDVPIAMSAFSAENLDALKIEGGAELLRAVPNVNFSKSNFASYNFSIRGIGTKAIAASTDPAVAISFNGAPLIRNRLFEQEYFDVERVEILRGPQGTLYGRNATGGVVNMIPSKPDFNEFNGYLRGETGNYSSVRLGGMANVPITESLALRVAGAWTKRDGFDFNTFTGNDVNDRDLWSVRTTLGWNPTSNLEISAVWERFSEDDNRSRTGKQLCTRDDGPVAVGNTNIEGWANTRGALSQGCLAKSIYSKEAFGVPNGLSMPHIIAAKAMNIGFTTNLPQTRKRVPIVDPLFDPYLGVTQSTNLREINTQIDPRFIAKNDVFQFNVNFDVGSGVTLNSQTVYTTDRYYSTQDYYRFISNDVFNSSYGLFRNNRQPNEWLEGLVPFGEYTDPQLGKSKKLIGMDLVKSHSNQVYQEVRIHSNFQNGINFNLGANYTSFKIDEDYYVFNNMFSLIAEANFSQVGAGDYPKQCGVNSINLINCVYVDPNPIENINGDGHNYFRSRNVSETKSVGLFGELYFKLNDNLKITTGLRYTDDKKTSIPYRTQLLLAPGIIAGGYISRGLRPSTEIEQNWGRLTGRFILDWTPDVNFADDLLLFTSYSRGYKGGGANPPPIDFNPELLKVAENPDRFGPESLNAFEVGVKGSGLGRRLSFNASAFYYDYSGYQISQIVDRIALNENFDADVFGIDFDMMLHLSRRFELNSTAGLLKTRVRNGEKSIDVMNRTQGNDQFMVVKPWVQLASNCIVPTKIVEAIVSSPSYFDVGGEQFLNKLCGGLGGVDFRPGSVYSNLFGLSFDPIYDSPNQGKGIFQELAGNELPNSPRWNFSLGAEYGFPIGDWDFSMRGDYYRQASSWARIYNTEIDRLKSRSNINISISLNNVNEKISFNLYVKNLLNKNSITDTFLNSDDSALTLNVFTVDPRIVGFKVNKAF